MTYPTFSIDDLQGTSTIQGIKEAATVPLEGAHYEDFGTGELLRFVQKRNPKVLGDGLGESALPSSQKGRHEKNPGKWCPCHDLICSYSCCNTTPNLIGLEV